MDKQRFCKILNQLRDSEEMCTKINDIIRKYSNTLNTDFISGYAFGGFHSNTVTELLEELLGDEYETVSWWCFETNYGKGSRDNGYGVEPLITLEDGTDILLDTPEKLYDFLTSDKGGENGE